MSPSDPNSQQTFAAAPGDVTAALPGTGPQRPGTGAIVAEPTKEIRPGGSSSADESAAAIVARRAELQRELARMGVSAEEARRLLEVNTAPTALSAAAAPQPKSGPPTVDSLHAFAATLQGKAAASARSEPVATLALPEFRESTQQEIRMSEALLRDAALLRRRENYKSAEQKCLEALNLCPKDAPGLDLLGDIYQGIARTNEALACYKRALEADPTRAASERKYADLLMRQQSYTGFDPEAVAPNSLASLLLSALLPGAGQFATGQTGKGLLFIALDLIAAWLLAYSPWGFSGAQEHHGISGSLIACVSFAGVVYVAALADASAAAKRNRIL